MEDFICVDNLKKNFKNIAAVNDISFKVKKGELFGFLGVNGAGKSTTINMLSTLLKKSDGNIKICGYDIDKNPDDIRKQIGIVFQENTSDDYLTIKENLILQAALYEKDKNKIQESLSFVTETLNIKDLLNRQFKKLSGGQKRRCEIAKALMNIPKILFLDEPTTGLDPMTRKQVWESIEKLITEKQMTVFLTTHYMEEAAMAQYVCIMDEGKIVARGTPSNLKNQYAKDFLKIYTKDIQTLINNIKNFDYEIASNCVKISVNNTKEALPIINSLEGFYDNFEVIQGNMDDVFLNITGKKMEVE